MIGDEVQLMVWFYFGGGIIGVFDVFVDILDFYFGFLVMDWIYVYLGDYEVFVADVFDGVMDMQDWGGWIFEVYY